MPLVLQTVQRYGATIGDVQWRGVEVLDQAECLEYLAGPVADRVRDAPAVLDLTQDLRALASTSMEVDTIERLLTTNGRRESWEVGEAMAECFLEEELGVEWPWNTNRDRRTPRASLPGADLVGFVDLGTGAEFAFGEVKTSEDNDTPPNVMTGRTGMIHQLEALADNIEHHFTLIKWLHARCKNTEYWLSFEVAAASYLSSGGRAVFLCGLLMRDTQPAELDLQNRALAISANVVGPASAHLTAWYLPVAIADWCTHAGLVQ